MKLIALETNRKKTSLPGDLRKLLNLSTNQYVIISSPDGRHYYQDEVKKVPLSTARAVELALSAFGHKLDGVVFVPKRYFATLGIKPGEEVVVLRDEAQRAALTIQSQPKAVRGILGQVVDAQPKTVAAATVHYVSLLPTGADVLVNELSQALAEAGLAHRGPAAVLETIRVKSLPVRNEGGRRFKV
jgi:bifunctional DNA-binding transcriptional regulator/antitoxin component of YhaV-PrlF toxin-antitoxin module